MIHGCQKKIYHVRNVGSRYFDEAYLVMRDDWADTREPAKDLAAEADRIIRESSGYLGRKQRAAKRLYYVLLFVLGALFSSVAIGVATLFTAL